VEGVAKVERYKQKVLNRCEKLLFAPIYVRQIPLLRSIYTPSLGYSDYPYFRGIRVRSAAI
jgi:hypothetical protein